jgi:hypothetical protein
MPNSWRSQSCYLLKRLVYCNSQTYTSRLSLASCARLRCGNMEFAMSSLVAGTRDLEEQARFYRYTLIQCFIGHIPAMADCIAKKPSICCGGSTSKRMKGRHSPGQKGSVNSTCYLEIVISTEQLENCRKLRAHNTRTKFWSSIAKEMKALLDKALESSKEAWRWRLAPGCGHGGFQVGLSEMIMCGKCGANACLTTNSHGMNGILMMDTC